MVLRGEDALGKTAVVLGRRRLGRASAGPVALSGGIGAVRRRRGGVKRGFGGDYINRKGHAAPP